MLQLIPDLLLVLYFPTLNHLSALNMIKVFAISNDNILDGLINANRIKNTNCLQCCQVVLSNVNLPSDNMVIFSPDFFSFPSVDY